MAQHFKQIRTYYTTYYGTAITPYVAKYGMKVRPRPTLKPARQLEPLSLNPPFAHSHRCLWACSCSPTSRRGRRAKSRMVCHTESHAPGNASFDDA
jgi:hypothetical protein